MAELVQEITDPQTHTLGGRAAWGGRFTGESESLSVSRSAIRLPARNGGPLALDDPSGSLGRLVLPRGMALAPDGSLYLLDPWGTYAPKGRMGFGSSSTVTPPDDAPRVRWFDRSQREFVPLATLGGSGNEVRQFVDPVNLAVTDRLIYVADRGVPSVNVFSLGTLALVQELGPSQGIHHPADVVCADGVAYIVDDATEGGGVFTHRVGQSGVDGLLRIPDGQSAWHRIGLGVDGLIVLLRRESGEGGRPLADCYAPRELPLIRNSDGKPTYRIAMNLAPLAFVGSIHAADTVRHRFPVPAIMVDERGYFCLSEPGADEAVRGAVDSFEATSGNPLAPCLRADRGVIGVFDRYGRRASDPKPKLVAPQYEPECTWYSDPIDSHLYRCQWHRFELDMELPPGLWVDVSTATHDEATVHGDKLKPWEWSGITFVGTPREQGGGTKSATAGRYDALVQSPEGRFLSLRIRMGVGRAPSAEARERGGSLSNNGNANPMGTPVAFDSPVIRSITLHYPRRSYLDFLPAVYSRDKESRSFLERYLSIVQTEWDSIESLARHTDEWIDPRTAPEQLLPVLANWLGLDVEQTWSVVERRGLLNAMPSLLPMWGTREGVRRYARLFLDQFRGGLHRHGVQAESASDRCAMYPFVVEGFRLRRHARLAQSFLDEQADTALWGEGVVGRMRLDGTGRLDRDRVLDRGEPEDDEALEHAHRFTIVAPAAWVRGEEQLERLGRAIRDASPAHTCFGIDLVEAAMTLEVQSTVGLDTIVGGRAPGRLLPCDAATDAEAPWNGGSRLGRDTVVGGRPVDAPGIHLDSCEWLDTEGVGI